MRYDPDRANGETATFDFKAWNQTNGTTAFSTQDASATITVTNVRRAHRQRRHQRHAHPGRDPTASNTLADADGLGPISYQWQANGSNIGGAIGNTLVLGEAQVGKTVTVVASYTDGHGTAETRGSSPTAVVANVNDAPTGAPMVTGTATERQTLTADTSSIADADGLGTFAYQWLRDGTAVTGATASSYLLGNADVAAGISVRVTYTDAHGTPESLTSASTAPVANVNDAPTGAPVITGSATEDQTLNADTSRHRRRRRPGHLRLPVAARRQRRSPAPPAATLLLGDADVGQRISVRVDYTDAHGTAESADQRGDRGGRQRQRRADRRAGDHRQRDRGPDADASTPRRSPTPTASAPSATSGCATASRSPAPPARRCCSATPMSAARISVRVELHRRPRHGRER